MRKRFDTHDQIVWQAVVAVGTFDVPEFPSAISKINSTMPISSGGGTEPRLFFHKTNKLKNGRR